MQNIFENFKKYLLKEEINKENLCLYVKEESIRAGSSTHFILYNPSASDDPSDFLNSDSLIDKGIVLSMVQTRNISDMDGPCYGAREVGASVSSDAGRGQGLGFLNYKIAIVWEDSPITGDRTGTRPLAQKVYDKLPAKSKEFDDLDKPKTPPKEDDCTLGYKTVNKAYWIDDSVRAEIKTLTEKLLRNNDNFMYECREKTGYEQSYIKSKLYHASLELFSQQYEKTRDIT